MTFSRETISAWLRVGDAVQGVYPRRSPLVTPEVLADVLWRRYCVQPHETLTAIGQHYGCSRTRIWQIEQYALRRLRHPSRHRQVQALGSVCPDDLWLAIFGRSAQHETPPYPTA